MEGNLTAYLVLLVMVVAVELLKGRIFPKSSSSSTAVGAVTHSPVEPTVIYENPIDRYLAEKYPEARR